MHACACRLYRGARVHTHPDARVHTVRLHHGSEADVRTFPAAVCLQGQPARDTGTVSSVSDTDPPPAPLRPGLSRTGRPFGRWERIQPSKHTIYSCLRCSTISMTTHRSAASPPAPPPSKPPPLPAARGQPGPRPSPPAGPAHQRPWSRPRRGGGLAPAPGAWSRPRRRAPSGIGGGRWPLARLGRLSWRSKMAATAAAVVPEEDTELRDLLVQTLENSGVLNRIKVGRAGPRLDAGMPAARGPQGLCGRRASQRVAARVGPAARAASGPRGGGRGPAGRGGRAPGRPRGEPPGGARRAGEAVPPPAPGGAGGRGPSCGVSPREDFFLLGRRQN